jgi:hypothetical protein
MMFRYGLTGQGAVNTTTVPNGQQQSAGTIFIDAGEKCRAQSGNPKALNG